MAKARKKTRKPAKRAAKKTRRKTKRKTVMLKGRKVVKRKAKRAAPPKQQGVVSSALQTVTEAMGLRSKLEGRNTFED